jgi:hypothetical protein
MANHGQDLDDFNARVLAELGQGRPPRREQRKGGWLPVTLVLAGVFIGLPVAGRFLDQVADKRHPERIVARAAAAAKTEREAAQVLAQEAKAEAKAKAVRVAEEDKALDREVRAEFLSQRIVTTRTAVEARLRDPGSATFRNVIAIDDGMAFCGEVNGANGFGGYAGWTTFIAVGGGVDFAPTQAGPVADYYEATFDKWCRRGGKKAAVEL